jgi:hypothetical protein
MDTDAQERAESAFDKFDAAEEGTRHRPVMIRRRALADGTRLLGLIYRVLFHSEQY